jgi:hypothetical protein
MSIQKGEPIPNAGLFTLDESGAPRAVVSAVMVVVMHLAS